MATHSQIPDRVPVDNEGYSILPIPIDRQLFKLNGESSPDCLKCLSCVLEAEMNF
jgi:hypothetical protein